MPLGSHPLGFGAVQSSSTRVSSPLATSFGFGSTAGPSTPTATSPYPHHWTSPHQQTTSTASPHHNPNPFAHAFARTESYSASRTPREATPHHEGTTTSHAKRRRSPSDDSMMERGSVSPTPQGRTMKRLRQGREVSGETSGRNEEHGSQAQPDLGVLLASLPSSTHLQILHSLIASHPDLKPVIHALIPPPEVSFAIQVLDEKVQRIVEAVPIGAHVATATPQTSTARPIGAAFGFGSTRSAAPTNGTVSDGYILNRLRIPLTEFTNVALTYLPYFITARETGKQPSPSTSPPHPSISFQYLSHLTTLIITRIFPILPPTALHSPPTLPPLDTLLTALATAWDTWLAHISDHVNARAGMYAASMAEGWIAGIETLTGQAERLVRSGKPSAQAPGPTTKPGPAERLAKQLRMLGNEWVRQVGWLIGRSVGPGGDGGMSDRMDE